MANFIDRLSDQVEKNKIHLEETLRNDATNSSEKELREVVNKYWRRKLPQATHNRQSAYAVDGSRAVRHLANGAYLFVAQALLVGDVDGSRREETEADVRILPGATPTPFVERFAELMMHRLEAKLAKERLKEMTPGSVMFMDGALYGQLPQLYKYENIDEKNAHDPEEKVKAFLNKIVREILRSYLALFEACQEKKIWLISIAKTSRDTTHTKVWWRDEYKNEMPRRIEVSATEALYHWTDRSAGYSTPMLLGRRAFATQPEGAVLTEVKNAPAILSFFVRLADFDDALRVDLPASCIGRPEKIGDVDSDKEILLKSAQDLERINKIIEILLADYGGMEVYNALLYSVDREVRLRQEIMDEVYFNLIKNSLDHGLDFRLDRSERRFHS